MLECEAYVSKAWPPPKGIGSSDAGPYEGCRVSTRNQTNINEALGRSTNGTLLTGTLRIDDNAPAVTLSPETRSDLYQGETLANHPFILTIGIL